MFLSVFGDFYPALMRSLLYFIMLLIIFLLVKVPVQCMSEDHINILSVAYDIPVLYRKKNKIMSL
jgi:hypothetical protein